MDLMSNLLKQFVGIAGVSLLLQVGGSSQGLASTPQEVLAKSSVSSSSSSIIKSAQEDKAEASAEAPTAPRVSPKNPPLDVKVQPAANKLTNNFAAPTVDALGEPVAFRATAYALSGRTRMGTHVRRGIIAADPRVLPLGSVVHIKSGDYSGVYTVHDTGGKIKGKIVDVWVPTNREARRFGRRTIKVNVLRLGPAGRSRR